MGSGPALSVVRLTVLTVLLLAASSAHPQADTTVVLPGGATMDLVWVEPGSFVMGTTQADRDRLASVGMWTAGMDDQLPAHEVTISRGFYVGKYEVTQAQYRSVMGVGPWTQGKWLRVGDDYPAVDLSWEEMREFLRRLNGAEADSLYRLPTEAEWEYACRAGTTGPWSFDLSVEEVRFADFTDVLDIAWFGYNACPAFDDCGDSCPDCYSRPVGTKPANAWGIHDMHGNVYEVVGDWYGPYSAEAQVDPAGPDVGEYRVRRGGDITGDPFDYHHYLMTMSAYRETASAPLTTGFRVVRMAQPDGVRAQAGGDRWVVSGQSVALQGTGSSPRGEIVAYEWQESPSNPAMGVLRDTASSSPGMLLDRLGRYRFSLRVSDGDEWSPRDAVSVEVVAVDSIGTVTLALDDSGTTMDFVWVEADTLTVGLTADHEAIMRSRGQWWQGVYQEVVMNSSLAQPSHTVRITRGYYLGRHEVTQSQWSSIMGTSPWLSPPDLPWSHSSGLVPGADRPAVWITWDDVQAYVARLNDIAGYRKFRLPTEAEWERASLADTEGLWSFGNDDSFIHDFAWFYSNAWNAGSRSPQPVGLRRPNRFGLHDMDGNVMEWTDSSYEQYGSAPVTDPVGPREAGSKVFRGGSFRTPATSARERFASRPDYSFDFVGVRLIVEGPRLDAPVGLPLYAVPDLEAGPGPWSQSSSDALRIQPNPFRDEIRITYQVDQLKPVELAIYNMAGQLVVTLAEGVQRAGEHVVIWDGHVGGHRAASGVYLCRLWVGSRSVATCKVLLIR